VIAPRPEPLVVVGRHRLPNTEDYYPPHEKRLGIEGTSVVRVCVDETGRRQGEPVIERSSGNARLDEGALNIARRAIRARRSRRRSGAELLRLPHRLRDGQMK